MHQLPPKSIDRPRVAVKICAPRPKVAHRWGDFHFAHSLVRAFERHGWSGEVHLLPDWYDPGRQAVDVVIHLRGLSSYAPTGPPHVNVLWIISHPDDVTDAECEQYDLVCVASASLAERLAARLKTPVVYLPQATDAARFGSAAPEEELATELLFVGNSRGQRREAVDWAIDAGLPLTVFGGNWDGLIPPEVVRGNYVPNEELGRLYASAKLVLSDHWPDMRRQGIVSNRVFDALAAGSLVISDAVGGLELLFGDLVPTFRSRQELAEIVRGLLSDPVSRDALAGRGRELVLNGHTFDHRAERLVALLRPLLQG